MDDAARMKCAEAKVNNGVTCNGAADAARMKCAEAKNGFQARFIIHDPVQSV